MLSTHQTKAKEKPRWAQNWLTVPVGSRSTRPESTFLWNALCELLLSTGKWTSNPRTEQERYRLEQEGMSCTLILWDKQDQQTPRPWIPHTPPAMLPGDVTLQSPALTCQVMCGNGTKCSPLAGTEPIRISGQHPQCPSSQTTSTLKSAHSSLLAPQVLML